jgi:hypothetical protein
VPPESDNRDTTMKTLLRLALLSLLMFVCYAVSVKLAGIPSDQAAEGATPGRIGTVLLIICLIDTIVLSIPILLSRYRGIDLILPMTLVFFGVETFMSQIETIIFNTGLKIPMETIHGIFTAGLIRAILFIPLAVWILGRMKPASEFILPAPRWRACDLLTRWVLLAALYVGIYFVFGYYVAWQSPDVRMLYSGSTAIKPFLQHTLDTARLVPWFFPIQFVRGLLWVFLGLMMCRILNTGLLGRTLVVALVFGVIPTIPLWLPNPWMSDTVRHYHFVETCSSMLLFGAIVGFFGSPAASPDKLPAENKVSRQSGVQAQLH